MKININSEVLAKENLTLKEFSILLYYIAGGTETLHESICNKLWNKGYLIKETYGYSFNPHLAPELDFWSAKSSISTTEEELSELANKLRALYPTGRKEGTAYMWRDSTKTIAKKLLTLKAKYNTTFTDEQAIEATKRYVETFNGNYAYMQLLKYFILKKDLIKGEETSQLLSYIENEDNIHSNDNGELI